MVAVILGISVPSFVFAALGQLALVNANDALGFTLLPVAGWGCTWSCQRWCWACLLAFLTRLMRSSMLEVLTADYIRTARARLSEGIFWRQR